MNDDVRTRQEIPPFLRVTSWPKYFDWPSVGGLRWLIFNAERNGFDRVIKRCGRRVLVSTERFAEWVEAQGRKP